MTGKLIIAITFVLFSSLQASAQGVNEEVCQSYINMFCIRCHTSERICDEVGVKTDSQWQETVTLMTEYGNLDKDVQAKVYECVTTMQPGGSKLCKWKKTSGEKVAATTVSSETKQESPAEAPVEKIFRSIGPQEALRMLQARDDVIFLDVRTPKERSYGAVAGSELVSIVDLVKGNIPLPKDKPILLVCAVGGRSYVAGQVLSRNGYNEVYNLSGGVKGWYQAGLPLTYDNPPVEK